MLFLSPRIILIKLASAPPPLVLFCPSLLYWFFVCFQSSSLLRLFVCLISVYNTNEGHYLPTQKLQTPGTATHAPARKRCTCFSLALTGHVRQEGPPSDWWGESRLEGGATYLSITTCWAGPGRAGLVVGQSQSSGTQSLRFASIRPPLLQCGPRGDGCRGARRPFLFPVASGWRAGRRPPILPGASHSPSRRGVGGWRR